MGQRICFGGNTTNYESFLRIVLECGIGTGFWLKLLQSVYHQCYFYGFDISKKILEIAQMNLTGGSVILREGDILKDESFQYRGISSFDIIFCYDVIQQLSDEDYMIAIQNMLNHLNHNGVAIIFDNEKYSLYGLIMSCKKLLTKFLRVPLVPYEICEVKYPPLRILNKQIQELGYKSQLYIAKNKIKRALVIYGK